MKRNLPILLAFFVGLSVATCNAFSQGISDVIEAAEAATPGPTRPSLPDSAPASGDFSRLTGRVDAVEAKLYLLAGKLERLDQSKRMDAIEAKHADNRQMLTQYVSQRTATPTPAECPMCGPNCRCTPGQCNCKWPGQCMGVPNQVDAYGLGDHVRDALAPLKEKADELERRLNERSVVKQQSVPSTWTVRPAVSQPAIEDTVWRPATSPVRISYVPRRRVSYSYPMYQASYGTSNGSAGGSVGGHTGYSYSSYPTYSSGYSSGSAVYCVDQYGNQVSCN